MDDSQFIARLLAGDSQVIESVRVWARATFQGYRASLAADLEDLEQEILLDLTQALRKGEFRGQCSLRTFVRKFAHYKCIDRLRALRRRQWVDVDDLELAAAAPSVQERLESSEAFRQAQQVLSALDEPCRDLLRMVQDGKSYREMSGLLGASEGTLRARVLRCRRRAAELREQIFKESR